MVQSTKLVAKIYDQPCETRENAFECIEEKVQTILQKMKDDIDLYKKQSITEATELHSAVVGEVEDLRTKL